MPGSRSALFRHGPPVSEKYIVRREKGDEASDLSGYQSMKALLKLSPRPDGVFCYNDPTAMGAMKAILEAGLDIPGDIKVAGCGNVRYADFLRVPLTTVDQKSDVIGERAAKLAISLVESKTLQRPKTILLPPHLIVRESTVKTAG